MNTLHLPHVTDFNLSGNGSQASWKRVPWVELTRSGNGALTYGTRIKAAWSDTGIYVLYDCEDNRLSCTLTEDFTNLFTEDVVEVFLWPDERYPLYLEYELSPLDCELVILVPNDGNAFHGWLPWNYRGGRRCRHATAVRDGTPEPGSACSGWSAELFIPFALMRGMGNCPPAAGTKWRANFYRIDTDNGDTTHFLWNPVNGTSFHDYDNFGTIVFD